MPSLANYLSLLSPPGILVAEAMTPSTPHRPSPPPPPPHHHHAGAPSLNSSPDVHPVRDTGHQPPASTSYPSAAAAQPQQQRPAAAAAAAPAADGHGFFDGWAEGRRYTVLEIIGKGSYGVVASAVDNLTGDKVAIKKIHNVFENVADATRILREIKLLRLLKHPGGGGGGPAWVGGGGLGLAAPQAGAGAVGLHARGMGMLEGRWGEPRSIGGAAVRPDLSAQGAGEGGRAPHAQRRRWWIGGRVGWGHALQGWWCWAPPP